MNNLDYIEKVTIKFDNTNPVEVIDFLTSVQGFHNQYKKIIKEEQLKYNEDDIKLYIHIRNGSLEWEFVRTSIGKLGQTAFDFCSKKLLHKTWNSIVSLIEKVQKGKENIIEPIDNYTNAQKCLQLTKNDLGSQLKFSYKNRDEELSFEVNGASGRGIYDKIGDIIDKIRLPINGDFFNEVAKLTLTDNNVIKCKIENISEKDINIICRSDIRQRLITENEKNPFSTYYIINGKTRTVEGKIIAYELTEIVEIITIDD